MGGWSCFVSCFFLAGAGVHAYQAPVPLPSFLIGTLRLGSWPVWLRRPVVMALIRRKSLVSLPFTSRCHGLRFEGDAANMIDYHILSRGAFEPGLTELLGLWGRRHGNGVLLDVGANIGVHTLGCAASFARVVAVEPYPPVFQRLEDTLRVNGIDNVRVCRTALADTTGKVRFKAPVKSNLGTGSIVNAAPGETDDLLEVPVITGDQLMEDETLPLAAVKIDTEGAERKVLAGLAGTIARDRPLVVFELLDGSPAVARELQALFPPDYRFFLLGNIKRRSFRLQPWNCGHGDIVALPAERESWISAMIA
jgi:FkbM family methyltransferase